MNERGERKARTPIAIRRRALTSFATRQFDIHGPTKRKNHRCSFLFCHTTTLNPLLTFNPVHLFFPFDYFSSKRSHLLPSRTHPPMHAHSSQKPSSKATGDTKRREESRRRIERQRNWERRYPRWKHRRRNSPLVP